MEFQWLFFFMCSGIRKLTEGPGGPTLPAAPGKPVKPWDRGKGKTLHMNNNLKNKNHNVAL